MTAPSTTAWQLLSVHNFGKISVLPSPSIQLQPKLRIDTPGDRYEREADRIAEEMLRMRTPSGDTISTDEPGLPNQYQARARGESTCLARAEEARKKTESLSTPGFLQRQERSSATPAAIPSLVN